MANKSHPMIGGESYPPIQIAAGAVPSDTAVDWSQLTSAPLDNSAASLANASIYTVAQANAAFLTITTAAATYAPLASPALTGSPTAPTQSPSDNSTKLATTAFVTAAIAAAGGGGSGSGATFTTVVATTPFAGTNVSGVLTASATGTVTIDGHLTALGDIVLFVDQATAADNGLYSVTTAGASGVAAVFTRVTTLDTSAQISAGALFQVWNGTTYGDTQWQLPPGTYTINSTGLVITIVFGGYYAPLASPALTGNPTAPTQTGGDNSTKIATTAFVTTALGTANVKYLLGTPDVPPGSAAAVDDEFTASSLNAKWSWVNQTPSGQQTAAAAFDSVTNMTMTRAANSAGNHYVSLITQAISNVNGNASPWSVTAKVSIAEPIHAAATPGTVNNTGCVGLFLYESATGKAAGAVLSLASGVGATSYTSLTAGTFGSSFPFGTSLPLLTGYVYLRISVLSGTYYLWASQNGRSWQKLISESFTVWFTTAANQIGLGIDNGNTPIGMVVDWFRDTSSIQAP